MIHTTHRVTLIPSFDGPVHDFSKPLKERLAQRKYTGPYHWRATEAGKGRGFYQSSKGLYCDRTGSTFSLRLAYANEHISCASRLARIDGYYADEFCDTTLTPIIARLPHGRGFLAGWTMGAGMIASLDATIWDDENEAALAAHNLAEFDAENMRDAEALNDEEEA